MSISMAHGEMNLSSRQLVEVPFLFTPQIEQRQVLLNLKLSQNRQQLRAEGTLGLSVLLVGRLAVEVVLHLARRFASSGHYHI